MHNPMLVIVTGSKNDAKSTAKAYLNEIVIGPLYDYYGPISDLDDEYAAFDRPVSARGRKARKILADLVSASEKDGKESVDGALEKMRNGAAWSEVRGKLRAATSPTNAFVLDATDFSLDYVVDAATLRKVMEHNKDRDLWVCGFDVHY